MFDSANSRSIPALILGTALALAFSAPAVAETRVVFEATKEQVKNACDNIKGGIPNQGSTGAGYGCYNPNNGVLVACSDSGTCTGYIPRAVPAGTSLSDLLGLKVPRVAPPVAESLAGSGEGGGGGTTGGTGGAGGGDDCYGCLY
jgi:hypothetical protein